MAAKRSLPPIRRLATAIEHPSTSSSSSSASSATLTQGFKAKSRKQELGAVRSNWLRHEVQEIFDAPLMETVFRAVSWRVWGFSGVKGMYLRLTNCLSYSLLFPSCRSEPVRLASSSTSISLDDQTCFAHDLVSRPRPR